MRLAPQHLGLASITLEELLAKLSYYLTVLFIAEVFASLCRPSVTSVAWRPASVHVCVHVFRRVRLTTFQLFQRRVSPAKVAGFTRRYSVTDQSGARISWPGSFLSACPPRISLTEVRMWSNGDHTCSLVWDQKSVNFKLYMCFYLWRCIGWIAGHLKSKICQIHLKRPSADSFSVWIWLNQSVSFKEKNYFCCERGLVVNKVLAHVS